MTKDEEIRHLHQDILDLQDEVSELKEEVKDAYHNLEYYRDDEY